MLAASLALLVTAAALLVGGVVGEEAVAVYAALAVTVLAALLLVAGVVRSRPRHDRVQAPTWSGAGNGPASGAGNGPAARREPPDADPTA